MMDAIVSVKVVSNIALVEFAPRVWDTTNAFLNGFFSIAPNRSPRLTVEYRLKAARYLRQNPPLE
jgi:hypothetical protein